MRNLRGVPVIPYERRSARVWLRLDPQTKERFTAIRAEGARVWKTILEVMRDNLKKGVRPDVNELYNQVRPGIHPHAFHPGSRLLLP